MSAAAESARADNLLALAREGSGDYRHPVPKVNGQHAVRVTDHPAAPFHNPVRALIDQSYRAPWLAEEYIPRHNDTPEFVPYRYRAPGWRERCARYGLLDLIEESQ